MLVFWFRYAIKVNFVIIILAYASSKIVIRLLLLILAGLTTHLDNLHRLLNLKYNDVTYLLAQEDARPLPVYHVGWVGGHLGLIHVLEVETLRGRV